MSKAFRLLIKWSEVNEISLMDDYVRLSLLIKHNYSYINLSLQSFLKKHKLNTNCPFFVHVRFFFIDFSTICEILT